MHEINPQITEVIVHPKYNVSNYSNDIAILQLSTEATFNDYVQPICVWQSNQTDISDIVGKNGMVVGWGNTETGQASNVLRVAFLPVIPPMTCLESSRDYVGLILSEWNYCAGFRNG